MARKIKGYWALIAAKSDVVVGIFSKYDDAKAYAAKLKLEEFSINCVTIEIKVVNNEPLSDSSVIE